MEKIVKRDGRFYYGRRLCDNADGAYALFRADYHKELYDSFIKDNGIDLNNLQKFSYESEEQYDSLYEQYPFDEFDETFYAEVESFENHLAAFIRDNINSFA